MAGKLALAFVDAFDPKARGCFIPDGEHDQSYKASATFRADYSLDSAGRLSVAVTPSPWADCVQIFISNSSGQSNQVKLSCSDNSNSNNLGSDPSNLMAGYQVACPALPFQSAAAFDYHAVLSQPAIASVWSSTPSVFARVVAASCKIVYTGSSLNDGGVMYSFVEPNHNSLENSSNTSYWSQFTSMKHCPLTNRAEQEITLFPIRTDMKEFSPYVDNIPQNASNGLLACEPVGSNLTCGYSVSYYPMNVNYAPPQTSVPPGQSPIFASFDAVRLARVVSKTLYPLSRLDQNICTVNTGVFSIITDGSGKITSSIGWDTRQNGAYFEYNGSLWCVQYVPSLNTWYVYSPVNGTFANALSTANPVSFFMYLATPTIIGAFQVIGGAANAGQTVHIEYTIHCEYSGIGVQGRMTPNPPDKHLESIVHCAVRHARDLAGQHPSKSVKSCLNTALHEIGKSITPSVIEAISSYVLGPGGGLLASAAISGYKRLR